VPKKLNDTQIAELIMKHTNGTSISALAKEYRIGRNTAKRYIDSGAELKQKCTAIKNETITEWIKNNSSDLSGLLDDIKGELKVKIKNASVKELFGGLKILTDLGINVSKNDTPSTDETKDEITVEIVDNSGGESEE
jgi:transposase